MTGTFGDWIKRGACRDQDPEMFFPLNGDLGTIVAARRVCAGCPVLATCAVATVHEEFGIWAGVTEQERQERRKRELLAQQALKTQQQEAAPLTPTAFVASTQQSEVA